MHRRAEIASCAMVVEAKDAPAADFYRHHGFTALPGYALTHFLPLATVRAIGKASDKDS